jgi:transcriptional regulator with XRE-family HTH domain
MTPDFDFSGMQERIAATRKARRMSLEDVGAAAGFTKSHVWEVEKGRSRNPTVRLVWGLSRALGVSPAWPHDPARPLSKDSPS